MVASGGKYLQAKLFQWSQEFIVKARALGVCFECVIFLKSSRFSWCICFPGIGSGEPFGNAAMPCAEPPGTEFPQACQGCGAAEVSPMQLQVCGAAVPCSWSPLHCARHKAFVAFAGVLNCELFRRDGNVLTESEEPCLGSTESSFFFFASTLFWKEKS